MHVEENFDVKNKTTFKIGGKIKKVYFPESVDEFVQILENDSSPKVFGNFSNTLVSSFGYGSAVIVTSEMNKIFVDNTQVVVGCGVKGPMLSKKAAELGLSGFEFMIGFPGSVGGNICMNASAHGQSVSDKLVSVTCWSPDKGKLVYTKEEMDFSYRTSLCQKEKLIVLEAVFELEKSSPDAIKAKMDENLSFRKSHQPSMALPNCGSVFRNPEGDSAGRLLELAGAKQMSYGGAKVWENHANFIINDRDACSSDVLNLMLKMKRAVNDKFNTHLMPELRFIGDNEEEEKLWKLITK